MTAHRVQRVLLHSVAVLAIVLAVTGAWLSVSYRPDAIGAWSDVAHAPASVDWPRLLHRLAAVLIIPLATGLLAVSVVVKKGWRSATAALALILLLAYTGLLLPWDQLALWAVTVGGDIKGLWFAAFSDDVRFVLIHGVELNQATLRLWLLVHSLGLPLAFAGSLGLLARASYSRSSPGSPPTSTGMLSKSSTARSSRAPKSRERRAT